VIAYAARIAGDDARTRMVIDFDKKPEFALHYTSDPNRIIIDLPDTDFGFGEHDLPPHFFARLIWRESLFRADAISPKGAEGIAQFMPGTAKMRGLEDSFDVVQALSASSLYLDELRDRFGNLGLAAAAYNAGEGGLNGFLGKGRLPLETRDYVFAITGSTVETWRDDPPDKVAEPLDPKRTFLDGCIRLATRRILREPVLLESADWAPWGVQLAATFDPAVTSRLMNASLARFPAALRGERAVIIRQKRVRPGMRPKYQARIGRQNKQEADALCDAIRKAGVACAAVKNW
ncbi:MAG: AMIN domain-containing protein, partial [Sphingomonadales bacterium]